MLERKVRPRRRKRLEGVTVRALLLSSGTLCGQGCRGAGPFESTPPSLYLRLILLRIRYQLVKELLIRQALFERPQGLFQVSLADGDSQVAARLLQDAAGDVRRAAQSAGDRVRKV